MLGFGMSRILYEACMQEALDLMVAALAVLDEAGNDLVAVHLEHAIQTLQDPSGAQTEA